MNTQLLEDAPDFFSKNSCVKYFTYLLKNADIVDIKISLRVTI